MAMTLTASKTIGLGGGVRLYLGTLAAEAVGDSSTIVVQGPNPISVDCYSEGTGGDWEKAPVQVSYSTATSTGLTTYTIKANEVISTGKYVIMTL